MVLIYDVFVQPHSVKVVPLGLLTERADQQLAIIKGHPCIVLKNTDYLVTLIFKKITSKVFILFFFFLNFFKSKIVI